MKRGLLILFISCLAIAGFAQTISAPSLHCATTQANGDVRIDWTNNINPCGPFLYYIIYASSTGINGPYTAIDTVKVQGQTFDTQAGANGSSTTWYYYMVAYYNCAGYSSLNSDTINNRNPIAPDLNYVTVNANGSTTINWQEGPSSQTFGYVIYSVVNGKYIPIDTVYGRTDTIFTDLKSKADSGSVSYSIAAIDSCENIGPLNTSPQHTIYMIEDFNSCSHTITLSWDGYDNWPGVKSFDVYDSVSGGAATLIGNVSGSTFTTTDTSVFNMENICLWVQANEQGGGGYASASNRQCLTVHIINPVTYCYIKRVTTVSNKQVDLTFETNPNASLIEIMLQRCLDNAHFYTIAYLPIPPSLSNITYSDVDINAATTSFYYRIVAIDSCYDSTYSSSANNIVLTGYAFSTLNNEVFWTPFNFQYGTLKNYTLYRSFNNAPFTIIYSTDSTLNYKEDVSKMSSQDGIFCYYIIATDSVTYPNGVIDTTTSESNELCLDQQLNILVPNAIVPNGKNNIFKPQFIYEDVASYDMQIYNRWGGLIFETTDYNDGWHGDYHGSFVEQGVYAYTITVTDTQHHTVQKAGTVMVIR